MEEFSRVDRLPPYVFSAVNATKMHARRRGEDVIDLGMGNPDIPPSRHIVDKLIEAAQKPHNHRYSASRGIANLRLAIANWYGRRFDVDIDPENEAVVTIGAKEGLSHLILSLIGPGDVVFTPNPTYPIHPYSVIIAGGDLRSIPIDEDRDFFEDLVVATKQTWPHPKILIISYPHNPTTAVVERDFFEKIVDFAKEYELIVVHDFAYADIVFDGYKPPSFLQVKGAKDIGVELFSLSKSYSMAGWRVGFTVGNSRIVQALTQLKSYLDYGIFQPIQIASIIALNGPQDCVKKIAMTYAERRDVLVKGLNSIGWEVQKPKATMYVWAKIPKRFRQMGSVEFSNMLIEKAKVAVAPGLGFGEYGDGYVRFALVENTLRIKQAIRGMRRVMGKATLEALKPEGKGTKRAGHRK